MILLLIILSTGVYFNFYIHNTNLVMMNKNILLYIWLFVTAEIVGYMLKIETSCYTTSIKYYIIKLDIDY